MKIFFLVFLYLLAIPNVYANAWIDIPSGNFLMGSTDQQIQTGYAISEQGYGHDGVREAHWFDNESPQVIAHTSAFKIMRTPVTQAEYAIFIKETGHRVPFVSATQWQSYHLTHPYTHVQPYLWVNHQYPRNKADHPVVLVSFDDALVYARWLAIKTKRTLQLPTEKQWEKAMRGSQGLLYPWGNTYHADYLNNADQKEYHHHAIGTFAVGSFSQGASPYGVLDGAGQVFEWTQDINNHQQVTVKGGSWDDRGGVCRPAAHHQRPMALKHILIGFRLVDVGK